MTATAHSRYSSVAIFLHWIIAALIIANIVIGIAHEDMAQEARRFWMGQHFAIGLAVLFLSVARLAWRFVNKAPPPLESQAKWERTLAWIIHRLFYVLMIVLPLLGWMAISSGDRPFAVSMWGLFEVAPLPIARSEEAHGAYEELHEIFAFAMIGLIVLHVAGALKHHIMDKDVTIRRMMPFARIERNES